MSVLEPVTFKCPFPPPSCLLGPVHGFDASEVHILACINGPELIQRNITSTTVHPRLQKSLLIFSHHCSLQRKQVNDCH